MIQSTTIFTRAGSWLGLTFLYGFLLGWHALTAWSLSLPVATILALAVLVAFVLGDLLLKVLFRDKASFDNLAFRLLSGTLTGVVCLYIVALVSPFGLPSASLLVAGTIFTIWALVRREGMRAAFACGKPAESVILAVMLMAVSMWCGDLLRPIDSSQTVVVIRVWPDVYYHLSQISAFSGSRGASTIYDVQMAGVVAHPYHFASYVFPALMINEAGVSAWTAYASFLVPVGILLTSLAAQALVAPIFGHWPSLFAGLALLLLPDASQQGFRNPFMGYHWLQQVAPAGSYGVASAAMAFLLMIEACRCRRIWLVFASYAFALVTLVFKAQVFVSIAYVILIFPAFFFGGLATWKRVGALALLTTVFIAVARSSQELPSVPVLRLDGSGLLIFCDMIFRSQLSGLVKLMFEGLRTLVGQNVVMLGIAFGIILLFITFGVFAVCYAMLLKRLHATFEPMVWLFPILIVSAFLVMALGLSLDNRQIGTPEELLHRPFVWAYFVLVAWTVAGAYLLTFGDNQPVGPVGYKLLISAVLLMVFVPGNLGRGIQTMKSWGIGYQQLPSCQVRTAEFIRRYSLPNDIVQDAENDPKFILSGLSERKPYVIDSSGVRVPTGLAARLRDVSALKSQPSLAHAGAAASDMGIQWFVVGPGVDVPWVRLASDKAAFQCGGYQAFRIADIRS